MKKKLTQAMMAGMTAVLSLSLPLTSVQAAAPEKEQTVYVNANETGTIEKIIVSNWLKNMENDATLEDSSELNNIVNVKGNESFTKDENGNLIWDANGNDIYYQGETNQELPVAVKVTYYLDGTEIAPSDLAGKSGKVTIRINYENHSQHETTISGKTETICTPFMMVTGMILPTETFTNIEVTNGKVISDGKNNIVVGMGFPGLADSLKLSDIKGLEEKELPDYVEITADATNFSLALTATIATTGTLNELGLGDIESMDELDSKLDLLSSSSRALVNGSNALRDGLQELNQASDAFNEGLDSADDGAGQLKDGLDTMNSQKGALISGIGELVQGSNTLADGSKNLQTNLDTYTEKVGELSAGLDTVNQKLQPFVSQSGNLNEIGTALGEAVTGMADGAKQFQAGADQVKESASGIKTQLEGLNKGIGSALQCMQLASGSASQIAAPDINKLSEAATSQAQQTLSNNMASLQQTANEQANAQQNTNVKNALAAAGLTAEQQEAVMKNLGNISVSVSAPQVQVTLSPDLIPDNSAALGQLAAAQKGMQTIQEQLGNASVDLTGITKLEEGAGKASEGAALMQEKLGTLQSALGNIGNIQTSLKELAAGIGKLTDGSKQLCNYNEALTSGAAKLSGGASQLHEGITTLSVGAGTLSDGIGLLADGSAALKSGTEKLSAAGKELKDGTTKLENGSIELADGMTKFNQDGIQKLTSLLESEVQQVLDRLEAVADADKTYTAFDGTTSQKGTVKFLIETAGIE